MSIIIVNLPNNIGKFLINKLVQNNKLIILNKSNIIENIDIKYIEIDTSDEDEYNAMIRESDRIDKIIYFPIENKNDNLIYINNTVVELITLFKVMQFNNINNILLISINESFKFMEEIIKTTKLNVTIIKFPDIISTIDIKDTKYSNIYNRLLGYMIGVHDNIELTKDNIRMIHIDDFINVTIESINNFKSKLNMIIPKAIEFTSNKINEVLNISYENIKQNNKEDDLDEWETLSIIPTNTETHRPIIDIITDNIEELKKKYILDSEHYNPLFFNKKGIFQAHVSSKIKKGDIFNELYNLDSYENKDEPVIFLGIYTKKDIIKLLKHRSNRYLIVDRILGQGIIETLKESKITYFSLSEEIKTHMDNYGISSDLIDLILVDYKIFSKINNFGNKIIIDHENDLVDELDIFEFVNISDIKYNDLPKIIKDSFIAIIKDNMYENELRISNIPILNPDDPNIISEIKKRCKMYNYGIMANVLLPASRIIKGTDKNSIIIRLDEIYLIPFCKTVFIKKTDLTKGIYELKDNFDIEFEIIE